MEHISLFLLVVISSAREGLRAGRVPTPDDDAERSPAGRDGFECWLRKQRRVHLYSVQGRSFVTRVVDSFGFGVWEQIFFRVSKRVHFGVQGKREVISLSEGRQANGVLVSNEYRIICMF